MNLLITIKKKKKILCKPLKCIIEKEKKILLILDLPIWNFTLSGFNTKLDYIPFIDLWQDNNPLKANWNKTLFLSLFPVFCISI